MRLDTSYAVLSYAAWLSTLMVTLAAGQTRYVILDSTQDSPSITALMIALEASSRPDSDIKLLGAITTESDGLDQLRQLLDLAGLGACIDLISVKEEELYPIDGYSHESIPSTVQYLIDNVKKYPGQVAIYSSASLASVAMAEMLDPEFGAAVAEIVIVGNTDTAALENDYDAPLGKTFLNGDSAFLRDPDAFMSILSGDIPLMRVVSPLQPVLSGPEIGERVIEAVKQATGEQKEAKALAQRPLARIYVESHKRRIAMGHKKAILLQEPGAAMLFHPEMIAQENDVQFESINTPTREQPQAMRLFAKKLPAEEIIPDDRTTLIARIDEDAFFDKLVSLRARDWSTYCQDRERGSTSHDEL